MIIDYLQEALKLLLPETPDWYSWAKTDSKGNKIPDDQRMQTKYVIIEDNHIGKVTRPTDKQINDKIIELKAEYEKQAYARARASQYPSITDVIVALAEKQEGDDAMWKEITALRQKVKSDIPKPT